MSTDNHGTAGRGRRLVAEELRTRGAAVSELCRGNLALLEVRSAGTPRRVHARVKTRTSGTWQGSTNDGAAATAPLHPPVIWIFVDLSKAGCPAFYLVPDHWIRRDIHAAHQEYLARHGGERAISKDSTHHAIPLARVAQWKDRWDLVGLASAP